MIPDSQIAEIRHRLNIADVVGEYVALRKSGAGYSGLCPFHTEKTPSFTVSPEKNLYYCFGCQKGGGLIDFVQEMEKVSFPEAVRLLAAKAGVTLQEEGGGGGPSRAPFVELNRRIADSFHHVLLRRPEAEAARAYLRQRQVSQQSIEQFRVGYVPAESGWLLRFLRSHNYSDQFLAQSGLFVSRGGQLRSLFWDRVMFPITTPQGEIVAFGGRSLQDGGPKYVNSPETPIFRKNEHLFGLTQAAPLLRKGQSALLVEGYMDVIALEARGMAAVATLGTSVTDPHAMVLTKYVDAVTVVFDGDQAGRRAAIKCAGILERRGLAVHIAALPEDKDPADLAFSQDFAKLAELVEFPLSAFQFIIQHAEAANDVRTASGKESIFREAYSYLRTVESEVHREGLLRELADHLALDYDTVRREYGRRGEPQLTPSPVTPKSVSADLNFMLATAVNRAQFERVRSRIDVQDLVDKRARELFLAMEECYRQGQTDEDDLIRRIEDPELRTRLLQKMTVEEFSVQPERLILEGIARIRARTLQRRRDDLHRRLRLAERGALDPADLRGLLVEKMHLDSELEKIKKVNVNVRHPE